VAHTRALPDTHHLVDVTRRRTVAAVLVTLALTTAGCVGTEGASVSATETGTTSTPPPQGSVEFPDGPKDPPERPARLNESSVRAYVSAVEYRIAYNSLWVSEHTEVSLSCRVDGVAEEPWGYEAVVTCTGYSNTDGPENATATPGPHADWFTQSFQYRVSADTTRRQRVDSRDPVS
jgi:hypothetical protein